MSGATSGSLIADPRMSLTHMLAPAAEAVWPTDRRCGSGEPLLIDGTADRPRPEVDEFGCLEGSVELFQILPV
jgi:hypothetical protein